MTGAGHSVRAMNAAQGARGSVIGGAGRWLMQTPLLGPMIAFLAATTIVVGPWLMSVLALAVISISLGPILGHAAIADLRLAVAYGFGVSLITTAPVAALTARLVRRAAEDRAGRLVPELYAVGQILAAVTAQALALGVIFGLGMGDLELAVPFVVLAGTNSLLLTSFAVLMALGRPWRLIGTFLLGTLTAIGCALASTLGALSVEMLLWAFSLGLWISHRLMYSATVRGTWITLSGLGEALALIRKEIARCRPLFFGVLLAMLGIWADKWVFWFGPAGMVARSGFYHFAPYDSAMFIAHLSMIPTLAGWFLFQERVIEPRMRRFWDLTGQRPTCKALESDVARLQELILQGVFRILFAQTVCSAVLILLSPLVARLLAMSSVQVELLQIGIVAVLLQSLFFLCCSILILCNRSIVFFRLGLLFFALNLGLSAMFHGMLGVSAYGVFMASLVSGALSFVFAYRSLGNFLYVIFVRENDGLYADAPPLSVPTLRDIAAAGRARLGRLAAIFRE